MPCICHIDCVGTVFAMSIVTRSYTLFHGLHGISHLSIVFSLYTLRAIAVASSDFSLIRVYLQGLLTRHEVKYGWILRSPSIFACLYDRWYY